MRVGLFFCIILAISCFSNSCWAEAQTVLHDDMSSSVGKVVWGGALVLGTGFISVEPTTDDAEFGNNYSSIAVKKGDVFTFSFNATQLGSGNTYNVVPKILIDGQWYVGTNVLYSDLSAHSVTYTLPVSGTLTKLNMGIPSSAGAKVQFDDFAITRNIYPVGYTWLDDMEDAVTNRHYWDLHLATDGNGYIEIQSDAPQPTFETNVAVLVSPGDEFTAKFSVLSGAPSIQIKFQVGSQWFTVEAGTISDPGPKAVKYTFNQSGTLNLIHFNPGWAVGALIRIDEFNIVRFVPTCDEVWAADQGMAEDVNHDCKVDFEDFAQMAAFWLKCNNPADSDCSYVPGRGY